MPGTVLGNFFLTQSPPDSLLRWVLSCLPVTGGLSRLAEVPLRWLWSWDGNAAAESLFLNLDARCFLRLALSLPSVHSWLPRSGP